MSDWPNEARAAVSVTFDNLGEAAELQLGAAKPDEDHYSVATALPIVLDELASARLPATFFVEGINAQSYPHALHEIAAAGHEVAYHAWCHEDWGRLTEAQEHDNLARGLAAMRSRNLQPSGFRPPGGQIHAGTRELLHAHGLRYCSPAGSGTAGDVLPFAWRHVDAYHLLPQFEALREHIDGSPEAGGPERVEQTLTAAVDDAIADQGHVTLVLHTWLVEAEREAVQAVLAHVRDASQRGDVWAARCDEVAEWVAQHPACATAVELDATSWMSPD